MTELKKIVDFLDEYLQIKDYKDASFNGLQFEGKPKVKKIIFAVDSGVDAFEKAVEEKADMVVVHHGIFWQGDNPSISGIMKRRLKILFENDISLYAAHLPLDKHRESGNNAKLMEIVGADITGEFVEFDGTKVGYIGKFQKETSLNEIRTFLEKDLSTECKLLEVGKSSIKTVGICSGGGGLKAFKEAAENEVDLYITGEEADFYNDAKDAGINVIFAGHHATEIVGVKALSKLMADKFSIDTKFIDIPTGL